MKTKNRFFINKFDIIINQFDEYIVLEYNAKVDLLLIQ